MCVLELAVAVLTRHPLLYPTKEERLRRVVQIAGNMERLRRVVLIALATWSSTDVWYTWLASWGARASNLRWLLTRMHGLGHWWLCSSLVLMPSDVHSNPIGLNHALPRR